MKFIITGDSLYSSSNLKETIDPQIVEKLQNADAVFTNAEFITPRKNTAPAAGRGYQTSVRPEKLQEFAELNTRYVSFANNHTGDYGVEGIKDTYEEAVNHGLVPLGIGSDLYDAGRPKFIDSKDGRIAIITIDVTRSEVFLASNAGNGIPARPGVNPLRWNRRYVLNEEDFEALKRIGDHIGVTAAMNLGRTVETFPPLPEDRYDFGSLFEGYLSFEKGENPEVKTFANPEDEAAILRWVADARKRSDYVFVNLHTHEGSHGDWYSDYPVEFIEEFAHKAIDAGADCIFGHGAHFARGVELYHEKPVFYNLGSLLMEFEAGESIISPEMFSSYGYAENDVPSTLHANRTKNKDGEWHGFYGDPKFAANYLVEFSLDIDKKDFSYEIVPLDLQMRDDRISKRGLPVIADGEFKDYVFNRLNEISNDRFKTAIVEEDGHWRVRSL